MIVMGQDIDDCNGTGYLGIIQTQIKESDNELSRKRT